jgi:hypothetical protein
MAVGVHDVRWNEFEELGEIEVRKRLAAHIWSEEKEALARQWIEFRESHESSESRANSLALAREANDLARSANVAASEANSIARASSLAAKRSADAAYTSNIIAAAALIIAIISAVLAIIAMQK